MKVITNVKLLICVLLVSSIAMAQNVKSKSKPVIPIDSKLNVENFDNKININMDISNLSISDLRVLRNAFAARQGYCMMSYDLRAIFNMTSWYDSIANVRYNSEHPKPIKYTVAESSFIQKLKAREMELCKQNFTVANGGLVNTGNIINRFQLEEISQPLYRRLSQDGFAIVPRQGIQLFHVYENNDYHDFPSFVTTDIYLQLFHMYFEYLFKNVEQNKLIPLLTSLNKGMYQRMDSISRITKDKAIKSTAEYEMACYAIGYRLLTNDSTIAVPVAYERDVNNEIAKVNRAKDDFSSFLGFNDVEYMYSLFRPRGHYTRTEPLKRYFKAMMWLQYTPCCLDDEVQLRRAILQASVLNDSPALHEMYEKISVPITFFIGQPDNVSVMQLAGLMLQNHYQMIKLMKSNSLLKEFQTNVQTMFNNQTRIIPQEQLSCKFKINMLPQRYLFDSEVLQKVVDTKTQPVSQRAFPMGMDVLAAYGCPGAENILIQELNEDKKWPGYKLALDSLKQEKSVLTTDSTVYNLWMDALAAMQKRDNRYPYFMQTAKWDKKNLNTALASWAELKHDAILYAKQPMGAECGGAGLPDPIVVGYVEPNIAYWQKALDLVNFTASMMKRYGLMTEHSQSVTTSMIENVEFLLNVSKKELSDIPLTEQEFKNIEIIGSSYEWLTLGLIKNSDDEHYDTWEDVQGTDKKLSVISDVYTANASNNPDKGILHEGTGTVDDMYVVVEINGYLYLTRGAVFSYREFKLPLGNRLTDEEWQQMLEKAPRYGVPDWMKEIIYLDKVPQDNELYFYSSGC